VTGSALSQLKPRRRSARRQAPAPPDLRESGAIEQDADVIMFIYRDEYYNRDSAFSRPGGDHRGEAEKRPTGMVRLAFFGEHTRFDEPRARSSEHGGYA
jgi:replicative DNA helicase